MEPIPLIPTPYSKANPDTSHVLRESFQDILQETCFPKNVAQNLTKFNVKNKELREIGKDVNQVYENLKINIEDIEVAELGVMKSQALFLCNKKTEGSTNNLPICSYPRIYPKLERRIVNKFSLIESDDLLPSVPERILDIKYNKDKCPPICPKTKIKYREKEEFPFLKTHLPHDHAEKFKVRKKWAKSTNKNRRNSCNTKNKTEPRKKGKKRWSITSSLERLNTSKTNNKTDEDKLKIKKMRPESPKEKVGGKDKIIFVAEPTEIRILNFQKNVQYERHLHLRNKTNKVQSIRNVELTPESKFSIQVVNQLSKIAPGMTCHLLVTFQTDTFTNFEDQLVINIANGGALQVDLASYRDAPHLKCHLYDSYFTKWDNINPPECVNKSLNYSIDLGSTLLGYCSEKTLRIKCCEGIAKFMLMAEEDWHTYDVTSISPEMHLHLENFHIYPAYFEIRKGDILNLEIVFHPNEEGFHDEKVFFVCENNNMHELDFMGDCILFDKTFIKFLFPNQQWHVEKSRDDPKYSFHLGAAYFKQEVFDFFLVKNVSPVKLRFGWKFESADNKNKKDNCPILPLDLEWISITPETGVFGAGSEKEFKLTVKMLSNVCGIYNAILSLYVYDIPEIALYEERIFDFDDEYVPDLESDTPTLLSVLVHQIEIQVRNIPLSVYIAPQTLELEGLFYKYEKKMQCIKIFNSGHIPVKCTWTDEIIYPQNFEIQPDSYKECIVTIIPQSYDDISITPVLIINDGYGRIPFPISGKVFKPQISVDNQILSFGNVCTFSKKVCPLTVFNTSEAEVKWKAVEYVYGKDGSFTECPEGHLNANEGQLCHQGSLCQLDYELDTQEDRIWMSIIAFYSIFEDQEIVNTHVLVLANIIKPIPILMHGDDLPFQCVLKDPVSIDKEFSIQLDLYNESNVETTYCFLNKCMCPSCKPCDIKICRKIVMEQQSGKMYPNSRKEIDLKLMPVQYGNMNVKVPFLVDGLKDTLYLNVQMEVPTLKVVFSLPMEQRYIDICWPIEEVFDKLESQEDLQEEAVPEESTLREEVNEEISNVPTASSKKESSIKVEELDIEMTSKSSEESSDKSGFLDGLFEQSIPSSFFDSFFNSQSHTDTKTEKSLSKKSLQTYFDNQSSICDQIIYFHDLMTQEIYKKIIYIENLTDFTPKFEVQMKNFNGRVTKKSCTVENLLHDLGLQEKNKFSEKMSDLGLIIKAKPKRGTLKPKETLIIEILVYAESWGVYLEEVGITIGDLPEFSFNIMVEVLGSPIEYPVIKNTDMKDPIIRFGSFSFKDPPEVRSLRFTNISTIPFKIVWNLLIKDFDADFEKHDPFNLICDVYGIKNEIGHEETKIDLRFINYYGTNNEAMKRPLFLVEPKEVYVLPKESRYIEIVLFPNVVRNAPKFLNIEACLVGHIYIEDRFRDIINVLHRPADQELFPTFTFLETRLEQPHLDLAHIRGDTCVSMSINDILCNKTGSNVFLVIVLKNSCTATAKFGAVVTEPFEVTRVESICGNLPFGNAIVPPNHCVQITVSCLLAHYFIETIADVVYKKINHYLKDVKIYPNNLVKVTRYMKIYQESKLIQELPLTMMISFPFLEINAEYLDFREVYIGCRKILTLKITNRSSSNCWFKADCTNLQYKPINVFQVSPREGIIPPNLPAEHSLYLNVGFVPNDPGLLEAFLLIRTCLDQYRIKITLFGNGTQDEKSYDVNHIKLKC